MINSKQIIKHKKKKQKLIGSWLFYETLQTLVNELMLLIRVLVS